MKRLVLLLLLCSFTGQCFAAEKKPSGRAKVAELSMLDLPRAAGVFALSSFEPPAIANFAVCSVVLLSGACQGKITAGLNDPLIASTVLAGVTTLGLFSLRSLLCTKGNKTVSSVATNSGHLVGSCCVGYHVVKTADGGLLQAMGLNFFRELVPGL